jgi:DNA-binding transcriptional LysR family regulator
MKLSQVRCFLAVCETRSFTRAARLCGISQPSLSMAIRRLERKLGATLFERRAPVELTSAGKTVRPLLLQLHQVADRVERLCADQLPRKTSGASLKANSTYSAPPQSISPPRR